MTAAEEVRPNRSGRGGLAAGPGAAGDDGGWGGRARVAVPTVVAAVVVWLVGMLAFYGEVVASGFRDLEGDVGDQRLLTFISEHWFRVVKGDASWLDPPYFHPVEGVLGYTEAVVLYQPFYVPLRLLGFDQFVAFQLTLMALTTLGFVSTLVLLRRYLRVRVPVALAGAFVVAFANNVVVKIGHGQMSALQLVPLGLVLGAAAMRSAGQDRRGRAGVLGAGCGLLTALLFLTSFYVAWFALVAGGLTALALAVVDRPLLTQVWRAARASGVAAVAGVAAGVVGFVVGIVPFLVTYLPVLDSSGGRPFAEVMALSPDAGDVLNVGPANLVWGQALQRFSGPVADVERSLAVTPILLVTAITATVALLVWRSSGASSTRVRAAVALLVVGAVLTFLSLRFGDWTAWHAVWDVVPGAKAIRAVGRVQLVVGLMVVVAWALVVDELWSALLRVAGAGRRRLVGGVVVALLALVGLEQVNTSTFVHLDRDAQLALLASVPPPPGSCSTFYVTSPAAGAPSYQTQIDAMLVGHQVDLPTINGYSGVLPPGYLLIDPAGPAYEAQVQAWLASEQLGEGVCAYDLSSSTWRELARSG